ncbi:MAG: amidohydrolase family protein [Ilumatobacter sp.]
MTERRAQLAEQVAAIHRPELGTIAIGAPADVVVVDLSRAHTAPVYDVEAALVYQSRADDVTHTIVGGKVIFDGTVVDIDEERVVAKFREHAHALRARSI